MAGVNKVIIVGNLGRDPETRYTASGSAITNITVATSESWKDKNTGQKEERTEWHRVVFFNKLAEIAAQYLRKGSKVFVEGSLRTSSYEKDGQKHYRTDIIGNEMQMLDSRGSNAGASTQNDEYASSSAGASRAPAPQAETAAGNFDQFDDDIPF